MPRWIQNLNERTVLIVLVLVAVFSIAFSALSHWLDGEGHWWAWADSAFQNFSTEMIGAVVTFALFELVIGAKNEKKNLLLQLGSKDNATALNALEQIKDKGWDTDGTLGKAVLSGTNLQGAFLYSAYMQEIMLGRANLQSVDFGEANLQDAFLSLANLASANFQRTNLKGANLRNANLLGAAFEDTIFDIKTRLPDGSQWSPETDMRRYTDPNHPDFWQPDWVKAQEKGGKFS